MSSFEPRGPAKPAAPFLPLTGPSVEKSTSGVSSVFADLVERSTRPNADREVQGNGPDGAGGTPEAPPGPSAEEIAAREAELREAYERGRIAGRTEIEAEYGPVAEGFAAGVAEVARSRADTRERHHRELLDIAFKVASKIVHDDLSHSPEKWLGMIRDGVHRTLDRETIRVRVGTSLHHYLAEHLGELRGVLEEVRELELVEDAALPPTGCVVETAYGDLDLGPDSQLAALQAVLTEES